MMGKIKKLLQRFIPVPAKTTYKLHHDLIAEFKLVRQRLQNLERMSSDFFEERRDAKFCPICKKISVFLPFGAKRRKALCPHCHSLERHRAIWFFLQKEYSNLFDESKGGQKILHFAPEKCFSDSFDKISSVDYYPVDFDPEFKGRIRDIVDIQEIPYSDNFFDLIMCNHILEHIPDDYKAMTELVRVLKRDGVACITVPLCNETEVTFEDFSINTPELRNQHFGQHDHVRKYGRDFPQRLKRAGFHVKEISAKELFSEDELQVYGIKSNEKIYFCMRKT